MKTKEKLLEEIQNYKVDKPYYREGQAVFNYIDEQYKVARDIQFIDNIDCFYNDNYIDAFICRALERINTP